MAHKRGSQRGVVKIASGLLLAGLGALLSVAGCAAGDGSAVPTVEAMGSIQQAISCTPKGGGCPPDSNCGDWTCPLLGGTCTVKPGDEDGSRCETATAKGICAGNACCTSGCVNKTKAGYECRLGTEADACGAPVAACTDCRVADRCSVGSCVAEKFVCDTEAIPDGKPCVGGGGVCMKGACCTGCFDNGVCQPGNTLKLCGVGGADQCESCDDGNPCTDDICGPKGCEHPAVEAGKSCDSDANMCNGTAKCEGTVCKTAPAVVCNDGNPCTNDTCTAATGQCVYTNNTAACSDGNICTQVDRCSGGACVGSSPLNCDDNESCTTDSCDKTTGCKHAAVTDNTICNDGNGCTTVDQCKAGKCTGTGGMTCDDQNPCTTNGCSANVCQPQNVQDGTACLPKDRCHVNSECQAGKCSDGSLLNCDDGNPCTTDSCDPATGCKHVNADGVACSDGDLCTVEDKCEAGKCVGAEMACAPIDDCHLAGTCNDKTGTCDDPRAPDDTECEGGKGKCVTGKCDVPVAEGGAGGEGPTGQGGDAAAGSTSEGGAPTGAGGEGNAPTSGGEGVTPGGGKGGTDGNGNEAGEAVDPTRVFQREPGGCSCNVPASDRSGMTWLAGLGLAALVAARRRGRAGQSQSVKPD
jgi:Dictyostelium (slime mold) repeat